MKVRTFAVWMFWMATPTSARSACLARPMCSALGAITTSALAGRAPASLSSFTWASTVACVAADLKLPPIQDLRGIFFCKMRVRLKMRRVP